MSVLLALSASLGADTWQAYSNPLPIYNAVPFGTEGVLMATGGGVRLRLLEGERVFRSNDGLEASDIYAVTSNFAVSKEGIVSVINSDVQGWRVLSRSYVSNKRKVIPGAMTEEQNILTIGFEDRLAFFNAPMARSILTINSIGSNSLKENPVEKIASHGDSLFVKLQKGTYLRKMDWPNLDADIKLVDPDSWTELPEDFPVKEFEPWDSTQVVVDGKVLKDSILYEHKEYREEKMPYRLFSYDLSLVRQVISVEKGYYLVGERNLFFYDGKTVKDMLYPMKDNPFPMDDAYEVQAIPGGGVVAASTNGELSVMIEGPWKGVYEAGVGSFSTSYSSRLKEISILPSGHLLFHVWGMNFYGFSDLGLINTFAEHIAPESCLESYMKDSTYVISLSSVPAPDSSGYIVATGHYSKYGVVYISKDGEVSCDNQVGSAILGAPLYSEIDENGMWRVYTIAREGYSLSADGWLDILTIRPPKSNGGEISVENVKSVKGVAQTPVDMVYEPKQKRIWMVTQSSLAYYDESRDTLLQPPVVNGIHGAEFTSIDNDPHGGLWVGTAANGAYRVSMKRESPDTLSAVHYSARDGMLSDIVNDVAVDKVTGRIWFAHDNGVSALAQGQLRDASDYMTDLPIEVLAFPNPFRPKKHAAFVIDHIAEDGVVSIYNRGGSLIRSFKGEEIVGGRLEWNGLDKGGRLVVPGVYYYVVKTSSKVKKGKFIIAH